MTGISMAE